MRITVYDKNLNKKAIFFSCLSIFWETRYFGKSSFCIEFGADDLSGSGIDVMDYITSDIDDTVMLATSIVYKNGRVTVSGFSADYLLHFRINSSELTGGVGENMIRGLISNMTPWDRLILADPEGITDTYDGLLLPGTVLDAVQVIAQGCDIGIRVRKDGEALKFECFKPFSKSNTNTSRLPTGYTELSYIETTGTQYIDTKYKPNNSSRVVMDFEATNTLRHIFGSRTAFKNKGFLLYWQTNNDFCVQISNSTYNGGTFDVNGRHVVDMSASEFKIDNISKATYTVSAFQTEYNLYLASCPNSNESENMTGKIYSTQIYDNGVLIRDLVPCISNINGIGMYDIVNKVFYGNAGTGVFVAGDVIEIPEPEDSQIPMFFSAALGNMGDESYTLSDQNFANVAVVKGVGNVYVTVGETSASGAFRREIFVDASSEEQGSEETDTAYQSRLRQIGETALADRVRIALSEFVLDDDTVKVGDLVKITPAYAVNAITARITSIAYKSQNNTIKRTVGVGTPIRRV